MRVFLQIDPPASFNPRSDSTIALALEAQERGYRVSYFTPKDLSLESGEVMAFARPITFFDRLEDFFHEGTPEQVALEDAADVVLIRQDPPYNMEYLSSVWMLERLRKPRVFNAPRALREYPEKLFPLHFPEFCPPSLISADIRALEAFQREHGEVVLKPLYGHGGHGVFRIPARGDNLAAMLELHFQHSTEPLVMQPFLPAVATEEKRILLIDGAFAGAFGRVPAQGEIRSNMRVGGEIIETTLTPTQQRIAEAVGARCKAEGILFAGLDVIGDILNEINITSPTGLRAVEALTGQKPAKQFWDAV